MIATEKRRPSPVGRMILCVALFSLFGTNGAARSTRVDLLPKLQAGQVLAYEITYRSDKQTKTKSPVALAASPGEVAANIRVLVRLDILGVASPGKHVTIHARATVQSSGAATDGAVNAKVVEFTILSDGRFDNVSGLDALPPELLQAWQQWAARFADSAAFPHGGIKPAQKWKFEEPERSPSPIAGLTWLRESTYVRNEPCRSLRMNNKGDFVESDQLPDSCAVVLTTASLKQRSKPKDATPEDYRLRQLRTAGTARGHNKTILYISLNTGLLVRSSDEADQAMSVTIAKSDGSNHLHYDIEAKSAAEVLLVTDSPVKPPSSN
jgi:hypothetical protein